MKNQKNIGTKKKECEKGEKIKKKKFLLVKTPSECLTCIRSWVQGTYEFWHILFHTILLITYLKKYIR